MQHKWHFYAGQATKQQAGEENARLRATLEEWSHRNALLEVRLNQTQVRGDANGQAQSALFPIFRFREVYLACTAAICICGAGHNDNPGHSEPAGGQGHR